MVERRDPLVEAEADGAQAMRRGIRAVEHALDPGRLASACSPRKCEATPISRSPTSMAEASILASATLRKRRAKSNVARYPPPSTLELHRP